MMDVSASMALQEAKARRRPAARAAGPLEIRAADSGSSPDRAVLLPVSSQERILARRRRDKLKGCWTGPRATIHETLKTRKAQNGEIRPRVRPLLLFLLLNGRSQGMAIDGRARAKPSFSFSTPGYNRFRRINTKTRA